jgi:hypothetical protein
VVLPGEEAPQAEQAGEQEPHADGAREERGVRGMCVREVVWREDWVRCVWPRGTQEEERVGEEHEDCELGVVSLVGGGGWVWVIVGGGGCYDQFPWGSGTRTERM